MFSSWFKTKTRKKKVSRFIKGKVYKARRPYDPENPQYDHYKPAATGNWEIADCWVVDANDRKHPGYRTHAVPTHFSNLIRG